MSEPDPKMLTLELLRALCMEYDRHYGNYPESEYEGLSLWTFIRARLSGVPLGSWYHPPDLAEWRRELDAVEDPQGAD